MARKPATTRILALVLAGLALPAGAGCVPPPDDPAGGARDAVVVDGLSRFADASASDGAAGLDALAGPDGGLPAADAGVSPGPSYTIVVLPDTQYYASDWNEIFMRQTGWVVANRDALQIAFLLHTGDVVDADDPAQWQVASDAMHLLDGQVPYALTAGNHDYSNLADRQGMGSMYFPPSQLAQFPWFGGTFEPGHIENNFSLFQAGAERWLVLALEFGARDEVLAWANQVLDLFPTTPAILITHAYLFADEQRYDHVASRQPFNPHDYVMMGQPGTTINDGEEMWRKLVEPHSNVKLVLSGHVVNGNPLPPGAAARMTSRRADGTLVHQMLANYQTCLGPPCKTFAGAEVHGGYGFLRLLRISPGEHTISVSTYSPILDQSLVDPSNEFVLPF